VHNYKDKLCLTNEDAGSLNVKGLSSSPTRKKPDENFILTVDFNEFK